MSVLLHALRPLNNQVAARVAARAGTARLHVVCCLLPLLSVLACSKDNTISQSSTNIGDVCGPKVACADGTCAFGYCRNSCITDSDCANSGVCLSDGQSKGCRLPFESTCEASNPCPAGLTCADDASCRVACDVARPCEVQGQHCQGGSCTSNLGGTGGAGGTGGTAGNGNSGGTAGTGGSAGGCHRPGQVIVRRSAKVIQRSRRTAPGPVGGSGRGSRIGQGDPGGGFA